MQILSVVFLCQYLIANMQVTTDYGGSNSPIRLCCDQMFHTKTLQTILILFDGRAALRFMHTQAERLSIKL